MRWFYSLFVLSLSACTSWQDVPNDIRIVAFHYGPGPYPTNSRRELVDVEIETNFNYMNYPNSVSGVSAELYFCEYKYSYVEDLGGGYLYKYTDKWIPVYMDIRDNSLPPYHYHAVFQTAAHAAKATFPGRETILDYDLRENPRDLCLYIDIGAYYHEKSNVVRIPKEELIKFFTEHPRPPAGQ